MRTCLSWTLLSGVLLASGTAWGQPVTAGDGGAAASPALVGATAGDGGLSTVIAPVADDGGMTGEQYVIRLRDLEQRINELKEEIFRSKARLSLLAESVLQNTVGGSRAQITHQNEMGGAYQLVSAVYSLDGAPILSRNNDNGTLADQQEFQVYNGQVGSGDHNLGVSLEYLGAGLPYMKGYRFRVRSTQSFSVPEGKAIQIRVVGYEKGGPLEPPENRPAVRYVQRVITLREASEGDSLPASTNGTAPAAGSGNP